MTIRHGHASGKRSPEYHSWVAMIHRCCYPNHVSYEDYGGRGIRICLRWRKFENFLADMGPRPFGHGLERIKSDGNYEPGNCRWATRQQQMRNRRNNVNITIDGITKCVVDWAAEKGIKPKLIYTRLSRGWSGEDAVCRKVRETKVTY